MEGAELVRPCVCVNVDMSQGTVLSAARRVAILRARIFGDVVRSTSER